MNCREQRAFTLVEILIVVVILGILAVLVIPNLTMASQESVKGALSSQMQVIESQYDLYLLRNAGAVPPIGAGAPNNGWDILVGLNYLKRTPFNSYTQTNTLVDAPGAAPNLAPGDPVFGVTPGWGFRPQDFISDPANPMHAKVFAQGYDEVNNLLSREVGYTQVVP